MLDHMARGRFQWGIGGGGIPTDLSLLGLDHVEPAAVRAVGRGARRRAQALGVRRTVHVSRQILRHRHPRARPGEGPRVLHEALPAAASAHRGGRQHAQLELDAHGGRARLDPHVELAPVAVVSRRPLAPGRGRRGGRGAAGERGASGASRATFSSRPRAAVARERARAVLGRNYVQHQHPNRIGTTQMASTKLEPSMPDEAVTVDYLMDNVWIVGDPSECVGQDPAAPRGERRLRHPARDHHGLGRCRMGPREPAPPDGGRGAPGRRSRVTLTRRDSARCRPSRGGAPPAEARP